MYSFKKVNMNNILSFSLYFDNHQIIINPVSDLAIQMVLNEDPILQSAIQNLYDKFQYQPIDDDDYSLKKNGLSVSDIRYVFTNYLKNRLPQHSVVVGKPYIY